MTTEQFGPYQLLQRLAVGGMGELYLAEKAGVAGFSKKLVVKLIRRDLVADSDFVDMFLNEGRVAALIDHPNVVQIYEMSEVQGTYFMSMEYIAGKDLGTLLKRNGRLDMATAMSIMLSISEGLAYAHDAVGPDRQPLGLVHRDLTPQNILISYSGTVKITDFGIAKVRMQHYETQAGVVKGKFGYLSTEQARGEKVDRRSDVYAIGLLMFEITTGQKAIEPGPDSVMLANAALGKIRQPLEVDPEFPPALAQIYAKMTAGKPEDRYQTVQDLQEDLLTFQVDNKLVITSSKLSKLMRETFEDDIAREQMLLTPRPQKSPASSTAGTGSGIHSRPTSSLHPAQPGSGPHSPGSGPHTPTSGIHGPLPVEASQPADGTGSQPVVDLQDEFGDLGDLHGDGLDDDPTILASQPSFDMETTAPEGSLAVAGLPASLPVPAPAESPPGADAPTLQPPAPLEKDPADAAGARSLPAPVSAPGGSLADRNDPGMATSAMSLTQILDTEQGEESQAPAEAEAPVRAAGDIPNIQIVTPPGGESANVEAKTLIIMTEEDVAAGAAPTGAAEVVPSPEMMEAKTHILDTSAASPKSPAEILAAPELMEAKTHILDTGAPAAPPADAGGSPSAAPSAASLEPGETDLVSPIGAPDDEEDEEDEEEHPDLKATTASPARKERSKLPMIILLALIPVLAGVGIALFVALRDSDETGAGADKQAPVEKKAETPAKPAEKAEPKKAELKKAEPEKTEPKKAETPATTPPDAAPPAPDSTAPATPDQGAPGTEPGTEPRTEPKTEPRTEPKTEPGTKPKPAATDPGGEQAQVHITSTAPVSVVLGGRRLGNTPLKKQIATGKHRLGLINRKLGINTTRQVTIVANKTNKLALKLEKGTLVLKIRPWAEVFINGVSQGTTPIKPLSLYEGRHKVKLRNDKFKKVVTRRVVIRPNAATKLKHIFKK